MNLLKKILNIFFPKKNCSTCKFAKETCKVFYEKYAVCYNGELWEKKEV